MLATSSGPEPELTPSQPGNRLIDWGLRPRLNKRKNSTGQAAGSGCPPAVDHGSETEFEANRAHEDDSGGKQIGLVKVLSKLHSHEIFLKSS
jgi:hypothetical protein